MSLPLHITEHLIPALTVLRDHALAVEHGYRAEIEQVHPMHQDSARNLLHYLALRQSDIRELQAELGLLGLSRLGRAEAHTLPSIEAVVRALHALAGSKAPLPGGRPGALDLKTGGMHLDAHSTALLGHPSGKRRSRIMVTMPGEAATRSGLVRELLAAGMDVMRINCAHDDPDAWLAMIRNLRAAEEATGRRCKIYVDLAGPKLRTGALRPVGRRAELTPRRDIWGSVVAPARIRLVPRGSVAQQPEGADALIPVDPELLAGARVGDALELEDSRGGRRRLVLAARQGDAWLGETHRHVYLRDGASCQLLRDGEALAAGQVGPLPEVVLPLVLRPGDRLLLTGEEAPGAPPRLDGRGDTIAPASIPCTLDAVFEAAAPGQEIWFDDGKIGGTIVASAGRTITVEITHAAPQGSKLRAEKGINLPDTRLATPALTAKDREDLAALAQHADVVGLSFVREADDVLALHDSLRSLGASGLGTVLKIETRQAFENLPAILLASLRHPPVGLMVARGDLAVEVGFERLAEVQEEILWLAEAAHVPVIWATQVLENMARKGVPSRAEVSDAAMGVRAECVMLNKGPYIVETTRFLSGILERMSAHRAKSRPMLRKLAVSELG